MVSGNSRRTGVLLAVLLGAIAAWSGAGRVVAQTLMPTGDPAEAWKLGEVNGDAPKPGDAPTRVIGADSADQAAIAAAGSKQPGFSNETRVLCLHSHTPDDGYTILQSRGFFEAIKKRAPGPVSLFREYLFLQLRGEDEGYHETLVDLLKRRYAGMPISIVMITDTRALKFWLDHLRDSMPGVPAVFSGSFQWFPEFDEPDRLITGAMEKVHSAATVDLIRQVLPNTRHVAVMGSASFFGYRMRDAFDEQLAGRGEGGPKVTYYTPTTWERIPVPFQGNNAADAMIYVAGPVGLSPGTHHYPPRWLQDQIPGGVPAFALFDAALGPDVIGGVVCSGTKMGEIAGIAAGRILFDGVKPADIPIDRGDGSQVPMFRWDVMRKWGITEKMLPKGSVIVGRPDSWLMRHEADIYRWTAIGATSIACALGGVTWGLIVARRRRLRAEAAMRESEERLQLMASTLGEAFWVSEPDGWTFRYVSEAWETLWGRPRSSVSGHAFEALMAWVHPDDRESMRVKCGARPGRAEPMNNSFRVVHPDGSIKWINCKSTPLFDESGNVTSYVGVQRDITDRMDSRLALEESQRRLAELVRTAPVAIIEWDDQWRCTRWDGMAETMFGWSAKEVLGRSHDDFRFIHPDDAEAVRRVVAEHEALRTPMFRCTNRHSTKSGEVRICEWTKANKYDENGKRVSTLSMVSDVTEREESRRQQALSDERYRLAVAAVSDTIYDWDIVADVVRKSGNGERLPEFNFMQAHGVADFAKALHPEDLSAVKSSLDLALRSGAEHWTAEYRHRLRDGTWGEFLDRAVIVRDGSGRPVRMVGAMSEVTQQRHAQRELRMSEERYRLALRAATDIIWDWDIVADRVQWGDAARELPKGAGPALGLTIAEWIDHLHAEDRERVRAGFFDAVNDPTVETWRDAYRMARDDGTLAHFTDHGFIVRDASGKAVRMVGAMSDVTAARTASERLGASELRLRTLTEGARCILWETKPDSRDFAYVSGQSKDILGYPPSAWLEPGFWVSKIHPQDREFAVSFCQARSGAGEDHEFEYRMIAADGSAVWLHDAVSVDRDDRGRLFLRGVMVDVSDKKLAQERQARSDERFRLAAGVVSNAIWDLDVGTGRMTWAGGGQTKTTPALVSCVMSTLDSCIGNTHEADRERVRSSIAGALAGGENTWTCEYRFRRSDGTYALVSDHARIVRDASGAAVRMVGAMSDITEQVRAREALRQSERRFRELAETVEHAFWVRSLTTKEYEYYSPAVGRMLGLALDRVPRGLDDLRKFVHPDDLAGLVAGSEAWIGAGFPGALVQDYRMVRADGKVCWWRSKAYPGPRNADGIVDRILGTTEDITLQREADEALRLSELKFRRLAESIEECFWEAKPSVRGGVTYVSPAVERIYGMKPEEVYVSPDGWRGVIHPEDRAGAIEAADRWAESGFIGHYERQYRVVHKDGSVHWVLNRGYAARDASGNAVTLVGSAQDVTQRVEGTRRLAESEAKFREIAENIRQVFWVSDPGAEGLVRYVSSAVKDVFGLDASEVEGTELGWAHLIHPDDLDKANKVRVSWYDNGSVGNYENFYRVIRPDGGVRHIHNRGYAVRDESGRIVRITGLADDITERELARLDLERSERRFREMAENIDQVFWVRTVDPAETLYLSPATKRLWGFDPSDMTGTVNKWRDMIHPDDRERVVGAIGRWFANGAKGTYANEYRFVLADGSVRWVSNRGTLVPSRDSLPARMVGVSEDITARKQAELALAQTTEMLERTGELARIGGWSVDLRTMKLSWTLQTFRIAEIDPLTEPDLEGGINLFAPEARPVIAAAVQEAINKGVSYDLELPLVTAKGRHRWVKTQGFAEMRDGKAVRIYGTFQDITERRHGQIALENTLRTQRLLLSELDHRVKNNLAGLLALIEMSAKREGSVPGFAEAMQRRVGAMVEVHAVLSSARWEPVDLAHMVAVMAPAEVPGRLAIEGPEVRVPASKATPLGMILQELLSNSEKYGALSAPGGEVHLRWDCEKAGDARMLTLHWTERGGPPIEAPPVGGLGTSLIEGFARYELRGWADLQYPRGGASHTIRVDISVDSTMEARQGASSTGTVLSTITTGV